VIAISCTQVEVHVFRRRRNRVEELLLRRSPERSLAAVWQPVTGGIERGESAMRAAAREVQEETGLNPLRWWALEHIAIFYDPGQDVVRVVPVFAAEVAWSDRVDLSPEHDRYAFVPLAEAKRRVLWGTQRRAMAALEEEVLSGRDGGAAREVTARIAARTLATQPRRESVRRVAPRARRSATPAKPRAASRRRMR
jgi:dATP pyrophosphohydrolase